jgi:hypothetical protein
MAASRAAAFNLSYPFFFSEGEGESVPLANSPKASSLDDAFEAPRDRGRMFAPARAQGESFIIRGDGNGVRSERAFNAGDDSADPGDKDPVMLAADKVLLR